MNPHDVTKEFENAVAAYAGSTYAVTTTSCTMAIFLSLQWLKHKGELPDIVDCPKHTYVSVPMQIMHCGSRVRFKDVDWYKAGCYRLAPTPVVDSARLFSAKMYRMGTLMCTSFHWQKTLSLSQGGAILTDDKDARDWLVRARFDGRTPGVHPSEDEFMLGWHAYMSPEVAAHGLIKLSFLDRHNDPLPPDGYPDLSKAKVFSNALCDDR